MKDRYLLQVYVGMSHVDGEPIMAFRAGGQQMQDLFFDVHRVATSANPPKWQVFDKLRNKIIPSEEVVKILRIEIPQNS